MKKILYLDYNVISHLRKGEFPKGISSDIKDKINDIKNTFSIPFSPAHLEDIAASKRHPNPPDNIDDIIKE